jgi:hypothetical protein
VLYTRSWPRIEAVSNTSTAALRVVGGGEKRSLEYEAVKYEGKSISKLQMDIELKETRIPI